VFVVGRIRHHLQVVVLLAMVAVPLDRRVPTLGRAGGTATRAVDLPGEPPRLHLRVLPGRHLHRRHRFAGLRGKQFEQFPQEPVHGVDRPAEAVVGVEVVGHGPDHLLPVAVAVRPVSVRFQQLLDLGS
jgi:hypothetical protein